MGGVIGVGRQGVVYGGNGGLQAGAEGLVGNHSAGGAFHRADDHIQGLGRQGGNGALPYIGGNLLQAAQVRPAGGEGAVRHPQVLHPQPALQHGLLVLQDSEHLLHHLLVGHQAHGVEHGNQDGEGQQHGQAGGKGVDALLLVQLGRFGVELLLVVGVLLLQGRQLRLNLGGFAHADAALVVEGHQHQLDEQGEDDDRPAVVAKERVDTVQDVLEKLAHSVLLPP